MRRTLLAGVLSLATTVPAFAGDMWVEFSNDTAGRLQLAPALGVNNPDEKDVYVADFDKDGDDDLVIVYKQPFTTAGRRRNVLLMNEGGVLVDRTSEYASASNVPGSFGMLDETNDRDVIAADVNGDGWLDIVTSTTISCTQPKYICHPRIYINLGEDDDGNWLGFIFDDEDRAPTQPFEPRFCGVAAGDVDADGDLDLYFIDYDSGPYSRGGDLNDRLWINDGTGYFTDESTLRMTGQMLSSGFGVSTAMADMNLDGTMDVIKNVAGSASISYNDPENEGFFDAFEQVIGNSTYHMTVGNLNNDERTDVILTGDGSDAYLINTGNGGNGLADFNQQTFPNSGGIGGNNLTADLNNDGWNDVIITNVDVDIPTCSAGGGTKFYRNNANAPIVTFTHDNNIGISNSDLSDHDVAVLDIDGDGWLDLVLGDCDGLSVYMNVPPLGINYELISEVAEILMPQQATLVQVQAVGDNALLDEDSVTLHVSENGGPFVETPMDAIGGDSFEASIVPGECGIGLEWFVTATVNDGTSMFSFPAGGPANPFVAVVYSNILVELDEPFEAVDAEWTVLSADLTGGEWVQVVPNPTLSGASLAAPDGDATVDGTMAWVTENGPAGDFNASAYDVDGGPTDLLSPIFDFEGDDAFISFDAWFFSTAGFSDSRLLVQVSGDRGDTWTLAHTVDATGSEWASQSFRLGEFITPTGSVQLRFRTGDFSANSIVEAGIDNLVIERLTCVDDTPVSIVSSVPADGSIDARQPFDINGDNADGWSSIELTFDGDVSGLAAGDFEITQNGGDQPAPTVSAVNVISGDTVEVVFSGIIDDIAWTTIRHIDSDTSVSIASLPGDVNGDGTSAAGDVLTLIDAINGQLSLPEHSTDIDRSGASGGADVLREIDLLNGANAYDEYLGAQLPL